MFAKRLFWHLQALKFSLLPDVSWKLRSEGTASEPRRGGHAPLSVWAMAARAFILCGIVLMTSVLGSAQGVGFTLGPSISNPGDPMSIAVGDFNRDGKDDLAIANYGTNTNNVTVLLGNGRNATFQTAVSYPIGVQPYFVTVGDFNGDGKLDLVTANRDAYSVAVLLGNGDGTFQAAVTYAVGTQPVFVAVGDFRGDGKADLAVVNSLDNTVSILLGNGDGTFQGAVNYAVSSIPKAVAVGDFNGDGKYDLAVANFSSGTVSVLLGNGDGTFQAAVSYGGGLLGGATSMAVGDFNEDGAPDLAILTGNNVSVLLGTGDGTFQAPVSYAAGSVPKSVAVVDFNGDGKPDLAVANEFSGNVSTLVGNGDGTFQAAVNYGINFGLTSVAVGDFDGSGRPGLAIADNGGSAAFVLINVTGIDGVRGDFAGTLTPYSQTIVIGDRATFSVAFTPLNAFTGNVDLSVNGLPNGSTAKWSPALVPGGSGSSTFTVATTSTTPAGTYLLTLIGTSGTSTHTTTATLIVNPPVGDFTGLLTPYSQNVVIGSGTSYTLNLSPTVGFTGNVALAVSGLPAGATASWSPATVPGGSGSSTLTISTTNTTPAGTYSLTLTGTSSIIKHTTTATLIVNPPAGGSGDFSGTFTPTAAHASLGGGASYVLAITPSGGFTGNVALSVSGLPTGATGTFSPASITGGSGTSTLTVTTSLTTQPGSYTLTVTATAPGLTHSTMITLLLQMVDFTGTITPSSQSVSSSAGGSVQYTISLSTVSSQPYGSNVAISIHGAVPPGVTASFSPATISPDAHGSSVLTLAVSPSTAPGTYTPLVGAIGGSNAHYRNITLIVTP